MTTDERIAELEKMLDWCFDGEKMRTHLGAEATLALACEVRALRLMLKPEIRDATWTLAGLYSSSHPNNPHPPIASRKAPDDAPPGQPYNRWFTFSETELRVMRTCFKSPESTYLWTQVADELARRATRDA
jgi:hypothetical protein